MKKLLVVLFVLAFPITAHAAGYVAITPLPVTNCSTAITTGGTAQTLCNGATPADGFEVCNPDPTNDLWVSDSTTATISGQGSMRVPAGGGCYDTPLGSGAQGPVSIIGPVTGQAITAREW